jgi:hypothetical protein
LKGDILDRINKINGIEGKADSRQEEHEGHALKKKLLRKVWRNDGMAKGVS